VFATFDDITDMRRAQEALRDSETRLRTVADFTYDWEWWRAPDGRMLYVSPSCERVTGFAAAELLADNDLLTHITHPDDRARMADHYDNWRPPAGGALDHDLEYRILTKDGAERWIGHRCVRVTAADGTDLGVRATNTDISARKLAEAEIRSLNEQLEERVRARTAQLAAANSELEAFVYSASHDLRAPLRAIDGFSQIVAEDAADRLSAEDVEHLQRMRAAAQRMGLLIDHLLALSRSDRADLHIERVDLSALAVAVGEELRTAQPERQVDLEVGPGLIAEADPTLLRVILANLLGNAWKFTGRHATAHVEVGAMEHDGRRAFFVRDDGAGFDPAAASHLFGAFQRYHSADEFAGDGIGLATVQRLVARHGGLVWAEAAVERGATFYFTLPEARPVG